MNDIIIASKIREKPTIPMMKGHTRIELTSVKTGEKKIIEHDNTFQPGVLEMQLRGLGAYINSPFENENWYNAEMWTNFVGGILLFEDEIDTTGGEVEYMPAGNKMIGNGAAYISNSGTPTELGSFNEIESSTSGSTSLTLVYDWGTSQANGTISCVCLTSKVGGHIGYGNPSGGFVTQNNNAPNSDDNQNLKYIGGYPYDELGLEFTIDNTAKTLTIVDRLRAITKASIFNKRVVATHTVSYTNALTKESGNDGGFRALYLGNGKFAIFGSIRSLAAGATYRFLIYDAEAKTATEKVITNDSGKTLAPASGAEVVLIGGDETRLIFIEGNAGTSVTATGAVEFSMSTGLSTHYYDFGRTITFSADRYGVMHEISEGLFAISNQIIDVVAQTTYPINGGIAGTMHWDYDALLYNAGVPSSEDAMSRAFSKNPLFLATVNNLESPVTKDSTMTMKVIYTLTEVSS